MKRLVVVGSLVVLAGLVVAPDMTLAATEQFTDLPVDKLAVSFFKSLVNVWIPIVALTALIGLVINMFVAVRCFTA